MADGQVETPPAVTGPATPIDTLFFRELADVYLLIDHVSASDERRLPVSIDLDRDGKPDCEDWITRICQITWPPSGDRVEVAKQAEFLISTRDALNHMSAPATGATIAFTLMVVDMDLPAGRGPRGRTAAGRDDPAAAKPAGGRGRPSIGGALSTGQAARPVHNSITGLTRYDLATQAFPELERPARSFARFNRLLISWLVASLVLVLALSWYVAVGNALLRQLHLARQDFQGVEGAAEPGAKTDERPAATAVSGKAARDPSFSCHRYVAGRINMAQWAQPWTVAFPPSPRPDCGEIETGRATDPGANYVTQDLWGAALVNVLGDKVLPACYGLLGAWAAVVRGLSTKIKNSVLGRRDHMISWIQLALGAVVGACIGLFVTPTGSESQDAPGLLGTATISFSALSFLAGYGVDHVFRFFDGVLDRVFPPPQKPSKSP